MSISLIKAAFTLGACLLTSAAVSHAVASAAVRKNEERDFMLDLLRRTVEGRNMNAAKQVLRDIVEQHSDDRFARSKVIRVIGDSLDIHRYSDVIDLIESASSGLEKTPMGSDLDQIAIKLRDILRQPRQRPRPVLTLACSNQS